MFNSLFGKKVLQPFFKKLHSFALLGLNYSSAKKYSDNGEKHFLRLLQSSLPTKDLMIMDVGANIGEYSAAVLEIFKPDSFRLMSFEPSKPTFDIISERFKENANIELINLGLSSASQSIELHFDQETSGLSSVYKRDLRHTSLDFSKKETIVVTTLDELCSERKIARIDFLKLDVEGHELEVLKGAKELLDAQAIKVIQFEFGGCNIDSRTYFKDFYFHLEADYEIFRIVKNGIIPIENYSEKLEIFQSSNFIAVNKSAGLNIH